ncbi:hypothetical protein D3C85_1599150 [compost metagenome]
MELRRLGVGETTGVGLGPCQQGLGRGRRGRHLLLIDHEVELAYAPGGLQSLYRHGEVLRHRQSLVHQHHVG